MPHGRAEFFLFPFGRHSNEVVRWVGLAIGPGGQGDEEHDGDEDLLVRQNAGFRGVILSLGISERGDYLPRGCKAVPAVPRKAVPGVCVLSVIFAVG